MSKKGGKWFLTLSAATKLLVATPVICALVYGGTRLLLHHLDRVFAASAPEVEVFSHPIALAAAASSLLGFSASVGWFVVGALKKPAEETWRFSHDMAMALIVLTAAAIADAVINGVPLGRTGAAVAYCLLGVIVLGAAVAWLNEKVRRHWRWPGVSVPHVLCAVMYGGMGVVARTPLGWAASAIALGVSLNLLALSREEFDAQCAGLWTHATPETMRRATVIASVAFVMYLVGAGVMVAIMARLGVPL